MRKSVLPENMSHWTEIAPEAPRETTALFARTAPRRKLIALVGGMASPAGKTRRSPTSVGETTVRLRATAFADDGIEQRPATGNVRRAPAASDGPPEGPAALRVSATRQGLTVKNPSGCVGVGVFVGVPLGTVGVEVGVAVGVLVGGGGVGVGVGVGATDPDTTIGSVALAPLTVTRSVQEEHALDGVQRMAT